uniref:Ubiquitin carboxyl-terminal hydrolase n=1 Tax=Fundulus heteroclitus TaxID=8078 RepID=A0A3Q2PVB1_FUNHE
MEENWIKGCTMSGRFDNLNMFGSNKNIQAREYHGLRNQGSTCYLNSVLQVLFMTEDFREAVGRCPTGRDDRIDRQLDDLFETLKERTGETNRVTRKLGIDKVNEQRDAAEYLEKILTLTSDEASKIFEGLLVNKTVCLGCDHESDEEKSFWNLPLPLRSSSEENYSVVEAIQEFFKDSHCTEDNQLYCETCEEKQDATIKCVVNHHPEVLMLLLKRFEFNYYQMSYVKNARVVDVPRTVQIPENQAYELYAFVEHFGTLNSGHYTATIMSQDDDRWYNFNDSSVSELHYHPFQRNMIKRSQSAYLLFYRKKGSKEPDNRKVSHKGGLLPNSNENKVCPPNAYESDEDALEKNKMTGINMPNAFLTEGSSDLSKTRLNNGVDANERQSHRGLPCNQDDGEVRQQTKNASKKPLEDENRVESQGEPDVQVNTRKDEDNPPKRRKTNENADKSVQAGLSGRKSGEMVEGNREKTVREAETSGGDKPEQEKQEQRESHAKQGKYQTNNQAESGSAKQINPELKGYVNADVRGERNKQVNNRPGKEGRGDVKPNQQEVVARQDPKSSSDVPKEKHRANKQEHDSVKKTDGKADESGKITRATSSLPGQSDQLDEKKVVQSIKEKPKSRFSWRNPFKKDKSKKRQPNVVSPSGEAENIEPNGDSSPKKETDATIHDFHNKKGKAEKKGRRHEENTTKKGKKKSSLNCFR